MVSPFVFTLAAVGALSGAVTAAYPSTFPFESEIVLPTYPPVSTPSHTYDDKDPGGYFHTYIVLNEGFDKMIDDGRAWVTCGLYDHNTVISWGLDAPMPNPWFNCTDRGNYIDENTYNFDTISGTKYCDSPEVCCEEHHGKLKYRPDDSDAMDIDRELFEESYETGMCTSNLHQGAFCSLFNDYATVFCNEQVVDDTERGILQTCFDSQLNFLTHCPVFKSVATKVEGVEPEAYIEAMTVDEWWSHSSMFWMPDKVCHPYSYFFPEQSTADSKSASDSDDDEGSAQDSDSDSAASVVAASFAIIALVL